MRTPLEDVNVDDLPLITPDSPPGVYRGPRGGLTEILDTGQRVRVRVPGGGPWFQPIPVAGKHVYPSRSAGSESNREKAGGAAAGDGADAGSVRYQTPGGPAESLPLIAPDSPQGWYRGPRGGVIYVDHTGDRQRLPGGQVADATGEGPEASRDDDADGGSIRYRSGKMAVKALQEWATVHASRDARVRAAAAAGVGVNEISRVTGIAKTTVIRILRR